MNPPKIVYLHSKVLGATVLLTLTSAAAQAETLSQFFAASKIGGQIRSYYFSRLYGAGGPNTSNQDTYSLGGMLNIQTAPFLGGFGIGVSFYTTNALGANNLSRRPK